MATAKAQGSKVVTRARKGEDGKGVSSVTEYYLASASSSGVTTSTSGWTTTPQAITAAKPYLWNYEKVVYTDGSFTNTTPAIIGHFGKDGKGISSITEYYLASASSSGVTRNTSGWTTAIQTITSSKPYLWNYEKIVYSDNTEGYTDPVIIGHFGTDGNPGNPGRGITSVTEYYLASASSSGVTTSTSGWTTTPQAVTSTLRYLWHFTRTTYSSGTSPVDTTPHIISVFADTGLTYRFSKWTSGVEYRNDNNPYVRDSNNMGFVDVVVEDEINIFDQTNPPGAWICKQTHTASSSNKPASSSTQYWDVMNSMKPIYTALVLANRIKAQYLDVGDLSANTAFITNLISQSAFIEQLNTKSLKAKEITTDNSGSGFLQMIGNVLQLFNSSGDEKMKIHGGTLSSISGSTYTDPSSNKTATKSMMITKSSSTDPSYSETTICTRTLSSEMVLKTPQLSFTAGLTYDSSSTAGDEIYVLMQAELLLDGYVRASNMQILHAGHSNTSDNQTIVVPAQSFNVEAGSHTIKLRLTITPFNPEGMDYNDELWASINGGVTKNTITWATSIQKVEIASNGFRVALASNVYFTVYLSGGYNYIQMMNENYGLRITNTGIQKTTNGGSTWTSL